MPTYNKKSRFEAHGGHVVPSLRRVAVQPDGIIAIKAAADTVLMQCPAIEACGNPVIIEASVALDVTADAIATFKLFRSDDAGATFAEISAVNRYIESALLANGDKVITLAWYDQPLTGTELAMAPLYQLVAQATAPGLNSGVAGHLVAHI